jgi:dual specificity tyrosine-phosphorylation-regulated kinase 2/3/4
MLGVFPYTQAIDMWSLGCIMIELFTGFPLFPGTNEREQLQLIIDVIGMVPSNVLQISQRKHLFSQFKDNAVPAPFEVLSQQQKEERLKYIMVKLRDVPDDSFVNFISMCLEWDPQKRLTPEQGLRHEWVLKGLPPNVLLQHQKVQNISNNELPMSARAKVSG